MPFQLICVLLGSCLLASVYAADVETTSESRDFQCFTCLLKCAGKILHPKEFGKCLLDCVNPSVQHRMRNSDSQPCIPPLQQGGGVPGRYDGPQCDADGNLLPLQYNPSTGYSWCVDKDGIEVEGTYTPPGHPDPDCGEGEGKAAAAVNGGECVSCALNCVTSGTCTGIRSCMACVGKCLIPGKSAQFPESESVEKPEEESASADEPTEEIQVTHLRDTGALTHPPSVQPDSSEETKKTPIHDLGLLTHPPVQADSSEETKKPTLGDLGLLTHPPSVQADSSEEETKKPTLGDLGLLTHPPSSHKPWDKPKTTTTTRKPAAPASSEEQVEQEQSDESTEFTHTVPTNVAPIDETHKPWDKPKTTTTTRKPAAPASSEEQVEQEQSDESAEVKPPPTIVTPIVIIKPSTKAAEPAELSEEPQQDQSDD